MAIGEGAAEPAVAPASAPPTPIRGPRWPPNAPRVSGRPFDRSRGGLILAVCSFVVVITEVSASSDELTRLTSDLEKATTQSEMIHASGKLAEFWDTKLRAIEGKIERRIDGAERRQFDESRERWRSYRSGEVAFRASFFDGGSMQPLVATSAYAQLTEHRVGELESLYADALGGRAEPDGAARGSRPHRAETNGTSAGTSSAAGSRR